MLKGVRTIAEYSDVESVYVYFVKVSHVESEEKSKKKNIASWTKTQLLAGSVSMEDILQY